MTGARVATLLIVVAASGAVVIPQQNPPPVFRARAEVVSVNVSVTQRNTPVRSLTAADFRVRDNGVAQTIRTVSLASVPLDVTLILDVSPDEAIYFNRIRDEIDTSHTLLRANDRLRVMAMSDDVTQVVGFDGGPAAAFHTGSYSAVHEALVGALVHNVSPDRRHVIVAFTNILDNISAIPATLVRAVARRSESVLNLVIPSRPNEGWLQALEIPSPNSSPRPTFEPHPPLLIGEANPEFRKTLIEAAETTGGARYTTSGRADRASILDTLRRVLEEYRSGYLLQYQPAAAPQPGWHELKVELTRGGYTVRARRGYFVGPEPSQAAK